MMDPLHYICTTFPVTSQEFAILDKKLRKLAHYTCWKFIKRNTRNNHANDFDDLVQEYMFAVHKAASYYKRQTYIEKSLKLVEEYLKDDFLKMIVGELAELWKNKKKHGAKRQKFGKYQEDILEILLQTYVPTQRRPSRADSLVIDNVFIAYCKSIAYNHLKAIGKKITKNLVVLADQISLNEHGFLCETALVYEKQ